jgi:gliding motility-associated-like protein
VCKTNVCELASNYNKLIRLKVTVIKFAFMRKYILALVFIASAIFQANSQQYYIPTDTLYQGCQPDSVHLFLFADSLKSTSYTYDTIPFYTVPVGGTSVAMNDDQVLGPYPVGFDVSWFCGVYTSFYICSNGWIGFQATTAAFTPQQIPSTAANVPKNAIMSVWRDWHPGVFGGPYITYQTLGVAPNRKLVVTWSSVPMYSCTTTQGTFQIVVHETSNIIHTNLTNVPTCLGWVGGDGTHGVHDPTGTLGYPVAGRNDTPFTTSNESLRFIPSSPISWTLPNGTQLGIGNDLFTSVTQSTYAYATAIQCDGDTVVDSVFIASSCINLIVDSIDVLCFGHSTGTIISQDTSVALNGPYTYYYIHQGSGDTLGSHYSTSTTDTLFNVPAGNYTVVCASSSEFAVGSVVVNEPSVVQSAINNILPTKCPGNINCDGSAQVLGSGGVGPYSYVWSSSETSATAIGLCADSNFVTITDANGCDTTNFVIIGVPDSIITTGFGDTLICISNVAAINTTSVGGTAPFTYTWSLDSLEGDTIAFSQAVSVSPVLDQRYFVSSLDANSCPGDTASVLVKVRPELGVELPELDTICPYDDIDIDVVGVGGDSTYTFSWSSGQFGTPITVSPDLPQWFYLTVSDACGTPAINDSVFVQVGGYSDITATIEITDDSICVGQNVVLTASGKGGFRGPDEYRFSWSKPGFGPNSIQAVTPLETGMYVVTVNDLCISKPGIDTVMIYVGDKEYPEYGANPMFTCKEADVDIYLKDYNTLYTYHWNFGDGNNIRNAKNDTVNHRFDQQGCYDIQLEVTTDFVCKSTQLVECLVNFLPSPIASFANDPSNPSNVEPIVHFNSTSVDAQNYGWFIDSNFVSTADAFKYEFSDTGLYEVQLTIVAPNGCKDTITKVLDRYMVPVLYFPSSFTPNGDGLNDTWNFVGEGVELDGYEIEVFDRWGKRLFHSNDPQESWSGLDKSTGTSLQIGAYGYVVRYVDEYKEPKVVTGQVVISNPGTKKGL